MHIYEKKEHSVWRCKQQEIPALLRLKGLGKARISYSYTCKKSQIRFYTPANIIKRVCIHRKSEFFYLLWMCVVFFLFFIFFGLYHTRSIWAGHGSLPSAIFNNINGLFFTRGWRLLPDLILYAGCKLKQNPLGFCRSNVLWIRIQSAIVCSPHNHVNSFYGKHETLKIIFRSVKAVYTEDSKIYIYISS